MPWVVGIDEAGYGPNLGPLVQAAVALRLPDDDPAGWDTLRPAVRRAHEPDDGRLLVDDSKKVHAGANGLAKLERGVFAGLGVAPQPFPALLRAVALAAAATDVEAEPWYDSGLSLPLGGGAGAWAGFADAGVAVGPPAAHLVSAAPFNRAVAASGTKGAVLSDGLVRLLPAAAGSLPAGEPVLALCDKQGGRNYYGPLLQAAFPDGWVVAEREGAAESRYHIDHLGRPVTVVFRPRADGESVAVALASMLCKYLREVCMRQFNAFWEKHVPGIKPTAGYPVDAKRFYAEIRPAMERLGIAEEAVWRKR